MNNLTLKLFLDNVSDVEHRYYEVQAVLGAYRARFRRNQLYGELVEAIDFHQLLHTVLTRRQNFLDRLPHIFSLDTSVPWSPQLVWTVYDQDDDYLKRVVELMEITLPNLERLIAEGTEVFDFVRDNIELHLFQSLNSYNDEGHLIVFEREVSRWRLYRYWLMLSSKASARYRTLNLRELTIASDGVITRPVEVVLRQFNRLFPELTQLPVYFCDVTLNFPFVETTLPVVKRMLMGALAA